MILRRCPLDLMLLVAPLVVVSMVAAAFYGLVRFRAPAEVSIVVLAAIALDVLARKVTPRW